MQRSVQAVSLSHVNECSQAPISKSQSLQIASKSPPNRNPSILIATSRIKLWMLGAYAWLQTRKSPDMGPPGQQLGYMDAADGPNSETFLAATFQKHFSDDRGGGFPMRCNQPPGHFSLNHDVQNPGHLQPLLNWPLNNCFCELLPHRIVVLTFVFFVGLAGPSL